MRCEVILPINKMRGEITKYYFTKLCLYMNKSKSPTQTLVLDKKPNVYKIVSNRTMKI